MGTVPWNPIRGDVGNEAKARPVLLMLIACLPMHKAAAPLAAIDEFEGKFDLMNHKAKVEGEEETFALISNGQGKRHAAACASFAPNGVVLGSWQTGDKAAL